MEEFISQVIFNDLSGPIIFTKFIESLPINKNRLMVLAGFEPAVPDSKSGVITTTL